MTLQQLKYVLEIVKRGSMNEAAKSLYITQPTLSNAIRELEQELGITIFHRTSRGITLSADGTEFLSYARQIIEQTHLLEQRYLGKKKIKQLCSVSTQHYSFAVEAFIRLLNRLSLPAYDFTLRETRTHEIIDDVSKLHSEIGIIYLNTFNGRVIKKILDENNLIFNPLFQAKPHAFLSAAHPKAKQDFVTLKELSDYPFLSFEQGQYNSFYFSEEIQSNLSYKKHIRVSDRATLFNLLIGLNGYTLSTGILSTDLDGGNIKAIPLKTEDNMTLGFIENSKIIRSPLVSMYIEELKNVLQSGL